ncbi:myosin heavy chain, cardiac muscle isoform-like isoform X2 [Heptranchias perlo]|uniref:myosin heavy chain, cardiac muscle isoform-like isoform X2 n=1 Tax=Heptranchias perlo TaxID=212740 RepID=UPI00355A3EA4
MNTLEYELYEKKFKDVTLPHFVSGISAILSFANVAVTVGDKDLEQSECGKMKMAVESAYEELSMAEKEAKGVIDSLTTETLQLTEDLDQAKVDMKDLEESLSVKEDELISLESHKNQISDELQKDRSSLQHMKNTLNTANARKGDKVTGRDMGCGLIFLVPCVGIPMTVDYNKELKSTKRLVKTAEDEKCHLEETVKLHEKEMSKCNSQIPEKSKEIKRAKESLAKKEREVEKMQEACRSLADIKCKLKYCYNYLYSLHGTVEVLHNSCQDMYSLDPIMPVIEETFKTVEQQGSHNELLVYDADVQKMVKEMKALQYRMK